MVAVNNLFTSRLQTIQQQQILKSGNINEQNISLFENTSGLTQGMIDGTCTDLYDDGDISFGEAVKSFGKGIVKSVTNMFSSPKNFLKTLAVGVGSAALIAVTGGAATPFLIAGGAIAGGVQVGKGIYDASQATTDAEKKQAFENIGGGTATLAMSVAGGKAYTKATGNALIGKGSLATYKNAATQSVANVKTNFGNLTSALKSTTKTNTTNTTELSLDVKTQTNSNTKNVFAKKQTSTTQYTQDQINKAFKTASKKLHPDMKGGSTEKFQILSSLRDEAVSKGDYSQLIKFMTENGVVID